MDDAAAKKWPGKPVRLSCEYFAPDIESLAGGGWMIAYSRLNQLRAFNTRTAAETIFASPTIGDRPDVEAGGGRVVCERDRDTRSENVLD